MRYRELVDFPTALVVSEFLAAIKAPNYTDDPAWYERINVQQKESMAIQLLDADVRTRMPVLDGVLQKLEQYGLRLSHLQMFVTRPGNLSRWHIDGNYRHASLNIPVFNCADGAIEWSNESYPFQVEKFESVFTHNLRANSRLEDEVPVIDRVHLTATTLVNSGIWHRLDNRKSLNGHRVVLSARFADNPSFGEVEDVFKRVFIERR